ncbi:hypothetical protein BO99DRAFT_432544 [Aspergillus violaceofuscus CBS 115571]|uniref:Xylanolytic transcriptional activator regulatory domain-containing protein n=1 Tax=Aspergillus violaceofuscus (strain CBS 115571) TaxID=1450538 RepID=A0A2V5IIT7_ASPV1|nr:hypothetical protein BO99DRAFT_432544 [Aspergillus violaceofuscus CBS 115571]
MAAIVRRSYAVSMLLRVQQEGFDPSPSVNSPVSARQHQQSTRELSSNEEDPVVVHDPLNPHLVYLGVQVLEFVHRNLPLLRNLIVHLYGFNYLPILPEPVLLPGWDTLWNQLVSFNLADESAKVSLVARIFHISQHPISVTESTSLHSLHRFIGGDSLRWETIGNVLMLANCDLLHIHYRDLAGADPRQREPPVLRSEFQQVIEVFTQLTRALPVCDELSLCLKYNRFLLAYHQSDDSGQSLHSSFAEIVSATYTAGFHRIIPLAGGRLSFVPQWRRRIFSMIYTMDKKLATFLDRPPLVTRQYCDMEAPADVNISDSDATGMRSEGISFDALGFTIGGKSSPITFIRLRFLLAIIKEEILELQLGTNKSTIPEKTPQILDRLDALWQSCPSYMKYTSDMWQMPLGCAETLTHLYNYLDFLHCRFLTLRLAQHDTSQECSHLLIVVAQEVLSTLLVLNEERDRVREVTTDLAPIFLPYGLPSAEILLSEMLRYGSSAVGNRDMYPSLSHAKALRNLTVYVSCLSWVSPRGTRNSSCCKKAQARLEQLLDRILDPISTVGDVAPENAGLGSDSVPLPDLAEYSPHLDLSSMLSWDLSGMEWGYAPFV